MFPFVSFVFFRVLSLCVGASHAHSHAERARLLQIVHHDIRRNRLPRGVQVR